MTHPPRIQPGGYVNPKDLPRGPNGKALCRHCCTEVTGRRQTFCSDACIEQWKIRTRPAFAKVKVFERDHGICAECKADCGGEVMRGGQRMRPGCRWEMDHIVPVVEGGGSCGIEGLRTLCIPCHRRVTAELASRRAQARRSA